MACMWWCVGPAPAAVLELTFHVEGKKRMRGRIQGTTELHMHDGKLNVDRGTLRPARGEGVGELSLLSEVVISRHEDRHRQLRHWRLLVSGGNEVKKNMTK
jgi:hypothetical protein